MKNDAVRFLIGQYMNDQLTEEQQSALLQLLGQHDETELIALLREMMEGESVNAAAVDPDTMQASLQRILAADKAVQPAPAARVIPLHRRWRWVAAAVCILAVGITGYVLLNKKAGVPVTTATIAYKNDVQPGGDRAILTLANGQQLVLDSAANGVLAQQGSAQVMKDGNRLKYQSAMGNGQSAIAFNTLVTPRGGQYNLILPDGSKAWLNAASSIRYPTTFTGNERKVEITGEVYFEITKNQHKPFRVQLPANAGIIEVLGTHFNVNTYNDEEAIKTTLLEGSVKIVKREIPTSRDRLANDKENPVILKPGEQAVTSGNSPLTIDHSPDLEQVMAWTNGQFLFRDQRIENIMKQLSRWYNVEISYTGKAVQEGFNATIPRNVPVSKVLRLLELTTLVHFKIEGRKITVLP